MEHFYHNVPGHMNFEGLYADAVNRVPDGGTMVEVGTWRGRSLAFLAVQALHSGKKLDIVGVDAFEDSPDAHMMEDPINQNSFPTMASVAAYFTELPQVRLIKALSWDAAAEFKDESVDFCFIDACHAYEAVKKDLDAWWPKIKKGGVFAGHDYDINYPGVPAALHEKFGPCRRIVSSWIIIKS